MADLPQRNDTGKAERRRRRRRRRRTLLALLAALIAAFYCFVVFRGPRDYTGEFAQLLPARTSAFIALNDFGGIRKHVAQTRLYAELEASVDVAALLMTNEDWRRFQRDRDSLEGKAKAALAREFLRRYFSQQVAVALTKLDDTEQPALLVMARTDLGFTEKLAELVAELYPELHLETVDYRGIPLHIYEGEKPKRSFSFIRFGKSVVISLRSNERDFLRRVIDYRIDKPAETLFDTDEFQRAWKSPARRRGLLTLARPDPFIDDMLARPDFKVDDFFAKPAGKRLRLGLKQIRFARIEATVTDALEIETTLQPHKGGSFLTLTDPSEEPLRLMRTVPARCLGFIDYRFGDLSECLARLLNIHRMFSAEAADPDALAKAVEQLNETWGIDVRRDLAPVLGDETAVVIHDSALQTPVGASLLIPVADRERADSVIGRVVKRCAELHTAPDGNRIVPQSFRKTSDFEPLYSTPLGFLGVSGIGDYCVWGLNPEPYLAVKNLLTSGGKTIEDDEVFRSLKLPVGEPLDILAFVNLDEIGRRAETILGVLALVSKSVRENWAKYTKIVGVVKLLAGVGLYGRHTETEWTVVLRVPTP